MKLFKKISIVILSIIAMFSFSMFFACDCGGSSSQGSNKPVDPPKLEVLMFEKSNVDLVVGDEEYLVIHVNNVSTNISIKYSSSDENIVTVSNAGKITAKAKGQAEVTASYGEYSAKCKVTVTHGNYLPSLVINNLSNDNKIVVPQGVDYAIDNYILFNGKKFTNATYTYQANNGNIRVTEDGVIKGLSLGESKVTVTASWDGVSGIQALTKTFTVKVSHYVQLLINGGSTSKVTLYNKALETLNGTTPVEADFVVTALDAGGQALEYNVELVNEGDAKYVTYDANEQKLVAQGLLTPTPVKVKVSVPVSETENYELFVEVECVRALGDYMNAEKTAYQVVDFNTLTGEIDLEAIFGFETKLDIAKLGREELLIEGNKIVGGIEGDAFSAEPEHLVITIYDEQQGYNVEIIPYVYKNAVELEGTYNFSQYDGSVFDPDFVLSTPKTLFNKEKGSFQRAYLKTNDGQKELTISLDGKRVEGMEKIKEKTDVYLAIASSDSMVYISATAYTLIIDEMQDFDYFYVKDGTWSYTPNKYTIITGFQYDGYYVLANDIDAAQYHVLDENGKPTDELGQFKGLQNRFQYTYQLNTYYAAIANSPSVKHFETAGPEKSGLKDKGFTGLFDGRGHNIANYEPTFGGLFHTINGGIVRNIGFTNVRSGTPAGVLANNAWNGAIIENIYIEVDKEHTFKATSWGGKFLVGALSEKATVRNIVAIAENTTYSLGEYVGPFGECSQATMENIFYVSPYALYYIDKNAVSTPIVDAEYLNGKINTFGTIAKGSNRYTSVSEFAKQCSSLDLGKIFNSEYWTLMDGCVPIMKSSLNYTNNYDYELDKETGERINITPDNYYEVYVGDYLNVPAGIAVGIDQETPLTVRYKGITIGNVTSITVKSGSEYVEVVDNTKIKGKTVGSAILSVTYGYSDFSGTIDVPVFAVPQVEQIEKEYYFSTGEGKFFTKDAKGHLIPVVDPLNEIFGAGVEYSDIVLAKGEAGLSLTIDEENETIMGVPSISSDFYSTYIDLYTFTVGRRINILSAQLIIDEAEDLKFFTLKERATYNIEKGFGYYFADGDYEWNGYFVLAKDIDASEYGLHDLEQGKLVSKNANGEYVSNLRAFIATRYDYLAGDGVQEAGKGFNGTLDGQGYTISNLTTTQSGLLGIINTGGVIRNLGLINCKTKNNNGGPLAYAITLKATIHDVYVLTDESKVGNYYSPLISTWGENVNAYNIIIEDKVTADSSTKIDSNDFGSLSYTAIDHASTKTPIEFKQGAFNNVYVISERALSVTVPGGVSGTDVANHTINLDAEFVDAQQSMASNVVRGIKRYTSGSLMRLDTENDYSTFNSSIWTMVNGVPKFTKALANTVAVYVGEAEVKGGSIELLKDFSYDITLRIDGKAIELADFGGDITVTLVSGSSVSVSNSTISANQITEDLAQIKVSNAKYEFNFTIDVILASETYEEELYLSGLEGKFYDANYNEVSIDKIFNSSNIDVVKAYNDLGEFLTVGENNEIFGVKVSPTSMLDTHITLYSENKAVIVNIKSLGMLIDEVEDLAYFTIKEEYIFQNNQYLFVDGDYYWNGYYLLTKDIDATGYVHNLENGKGKIVTEYTAARLDYLAGSGFNKGGPFIHGFLGTFDGQGHTISNLTTTESGLFGVIGGGAVIKDVAFVNNRVDTNDGGFLAWAICNDAKVENVYVETNYDVVSNKYAPFIATWGPKAKAENVIVVDNTYKRDYAITSEYKIGSLTADARHQGNYKNQLISFPETAFSNYYIISDKALSEIIESNVNGYGGTVKMDAQFVDGVENTADGMITGINRYTSMAKFTEAITANPNLLANFAKSNVWEIASDSISFKGVSDVKVANVVLGDKVVTNNADVLIGDTFTVGLMVNGVMNTVDSVAVEEDNTLATVNGTTLTVGTTTGSVKITVTAGEDVYEVVLKVVNPRVKFNNSIIKEGDVLKVMLGSTNKVDLLSAMSSVEGWTIDTPETTELITIADGVVTASNSAYGQSEVRVEYKGWSFVFTVVVERPDVYINGLINERYSTVVIVDKQIEVSLKYNDVALEGDITLTADNNNVTFEGNLIKGAVSGSSVVTIAINGITLQINVLISSEIEELDIEPYFSAGDGLFFNESLTGVMGAEELFGSTDAQIVAAEDGEGNPLVISKDGAILGLKTGKQLESKTLIIYTTSKSIKLTVKAYGLIIDEASDLAYFNIKKDPVLTTTADGKYYIAHGYEFAEGDVEFGGYYIMINDIDATGYTHNFNNDLQDPSFGSYNIVNLSKLSAVENKGLTGIFDGNGYTISNITIAKNGLFGLINGGTVKNLSVVDFTRTAGGGTIADYMINGAVVQDCYQSIKTSRNNGYGTPFIANQVTSDCVIERNVIYFGHYNETGATEGILGSNACANEVIKDSYYITTYNRASIISPSSKLTLVAKDNSTFDANIQITLADAKYVDGVLQTGITDKFQQTWSTNVYSINDYTSIGTYTKAYEYTLLEGLKKYTSFDKMTEDVANNDFSDWNSDIWEIVNGVPTFLSSITGNYSLKMGAQDVTDGQSLKLIEGSAVDFSVVLDGKLINTNPTIQVVGQDGVVSINGAKVIASQSGTVKLKVSYRKLSYTLDVAVYSDPSAIAEEYQFSAADGVLFDGDTVVSLADLFGGELDANVTAFDADGNPLNVVDGKILGVETSAKDWLPSSLIIYSGDNGIKVNVQIAELILDEATDLAYFGVNGTVTNGVVPASGEGVFDGFYVVVKDIDATGYIHTFADESLEADYFNASTRGFSKVKADVEKDGVLYGKYMTGVFDGQGYTISNYMMLGSASNSGTAQSNGGLFGIINGGTVKNVSFVNINNTTANVYTVASGVLATYIVNGATVSDVYIHYAGNMNAGGPNGLICSAVEADCVVKNVLVNWTGNKSVAGEAGLVGSYISEANSALKDVYIISSVPTNFTSHQMASTWDKETGAFVQDVYYVHKVAGDAKYVDGQLSASTSNIFHKAWGLTTTYSSAEYDVLFGGSTRHTADTVEGGMVTKYTGAYDITILEGVKRFTSLAKMKENASLNDFSSWNSSIWEVVDGVPQMLKKTTGEYSAVFAGNEVSETAAQLSAGKSYTATIKLNDSTVGFKPTVEIISGSEFISVEGNVVTTKKASDGETVTIKITYRNNVWTQDIIVNVPATDHEKELQFSAVDGVFFDGKNVVDITDIIGELNVTTVVDKNGAVLNYENGVVSGLTTTTTDWEDNSITFYGKDRGVNVNVKVAELIIDEASDFDYFTAGAIAHEGWGIKVPEGSFKFDGFYVLAKNIDATGYTHNLYKDTTYTDTLDKMSWGGQHASWYAYQGVVPGLKVNSNAVNGLEGVFDGQGYSVSNLTTNANGLFGIISTGSVKNTGFYNCKTQNLDGGFLARMMLSEKGSISNVYVVTPTAEVNSGFAPLIHDVSFKGGKWNNVVVIDNTTLPSTAPTTDFETGSMTVDFWRQGGNVSYYHNTFGTNATTSPDTFMQNNFFISDKPLCGVITAETTVVTPKIDTLYVDGVNNTNGAALLETNYTTYRYNSYSKFISDASKCNFTTFDSSMWRKIDGVPVFNTIIDVIPTTDYIVKINGKAIDTETAYSMEKAASAEIEVCANHIGVDSKVSIVKGNELITLTDNKITTAKSGTVVARITSDDFTFDLTIFIELDVKYMETEFYFGTEEGLFYDMNTWTVVDVLGYIDGEILTTSASNGQTVALKDGKITGLSVDGAIEDITLTANTSECSYKVGIKALTLVIDEAKDLEYFTLKQDLGSGNENYNNYNIAHMDYAEGDFEFGGYYKVIKNIDATGYTHDFRNTVVTGKGTAPSYNSVGYTNYAKLLPADKGLNGVFDGSGYTISNLTIATGGLFGAINGGTVKDLSLTNVLFADEDTDTETYGKAQGVKDSNGIFGYVAINNSTITDVNIQSQYKMFNGCSLMFLLLAYIQDGSVIKNSMVTWVPSSGQVTWGGGSGVGLIGTVEADTCMQNVLFVSPYELTLGGYQAARIRTAESEKVIYARPILSDAEYIDGKLASNSSSKYYAQWDMRYSYDLTSYAELKKSENAEDSSFVDPTYTLKLVKGIKRYTNATKLSDDAKNNSFTGWNTSVWTVTNGVPQFTKAPV